MAKFEPYELEQTIAHRFERMVEQYPDNTAIQDDQNTYTYSALNQRVNRAAHLIRERLGTGREPVALLFDHDAQPIIGMLAVLKAGRPYLPLSPHVPDSRNAQIIADAEALLLVVDPVYAGVDSGVPVVTLEDAATFSDQNPPLAIDPDDPCYLIYTSGSTGDPKGILHTQRSALYPITVDVDYMNITSEDRTALVFSYNFGASRIPIFNSLLTGASLHPFDLREHGVIPFSEWLRDRRITLLTCMPSMFRPIFEHRVSFPDLRIVQFSTEAVTGDDVAAMRRMIPQESVIIHGLGTSETNKLTTRVLTHDIPLEEGVLPVGYAMPGWEFVILGEDGEHLGPGQTGEIGIRSRYIAEGYLHAPELNAKKFLPDPDGGDKRIFLTGDIGEVRPDGNLIHLGRRDSQVKIRGHRVEMAEVEMLLRRIDIVHDAVVIAATHPSGDKVLIAYVIPSEADVTPAALHAAFPGRLPDYMIPNQILLLEKLPLTATGKVDRKQLPEPIFGSRSLDTPYLAPRTTLERILVHMWEEILGISPVGVADAFTELGGDSLKALKVFSRIEIELGKRLPVNVMLEASTIEKLSQAIVEENLKPPWPSLVPMQTGGSQPPLFCVHGLGGHVYTFHLFAHYLGEDQPVYALRAQGLDGVTPPSQSFDEIAAHYIKEIKQVQESGPYYLSGVSAGGKIAYEMAVQLQAAGEEVRLVVAIDTVVTKDEEGKGLIDLEAFEEAERREKPASPVEANRIQYHTERTRQMNLLQKVGYYAAVIRRWLYYRFIQPLPRLFADPHMGDPRWTPERRLRWALQIASEKHQMKPYTGRVILLRSEEAHVKLPNPMPHWEEWVRGEVRLLEIPGDHTTMLIDPHVQTMSRHLTSLLAEARLLDTSKVATAGAG